MVIFAEKMRREASIRSGFLKVATFILHSFEFLFHIMIQATFVHACRIYTHHADGAARAK